LARRRAARFAVAKFAAQLGIVGVLGVFVVRIIIHGAAFSIKTWRCLWNDLRKIAANAG
jgi:hypothetical protein